ncbi:MAG: hypothetical protein HQ581_20860, partial [Planctomycetes bacterium]|nr:hypothetical protein [Planctomycetota bacterium]
VPIYQQQIAKPGADQFFAVIKFLETTLETDWRTGLGKLSGGGITLAVGPGENVLLMVDAEDERLLQRLHEILLKFAQSDAKKKGHPERVATDEYRGVPTWTFNGTEAHAMIGRRLIVASTAEGLQGVLDLRAETEGKSLASASGYQAARRAVGTDAPAMAYADLKTLKHIPQIAEALKLDRSNPLAALLLAGVTEAARASTWLALGLDVEDDTLVLRALLDGKRADATGPAAFALPSKSGEGVLPNLSVPRRIAALSFHRDLHRFYAAKDDLFPDRTSGLIFFENMMGIFFSGRDLTDEVLARTRPEVRFVVAEQEYDPAIGTPGTQLPAFAVILRLRHATEFDIVFEEAWQKAVGLISFTRGQQAQSGLIIDRVVQGDTKFTLAYFSSAEVEDKANLPQRFNFRPAVAMPGDYVVLSSTEGLARDLIDALERETAGNVRPTTGVDSLVELDGDQLASILQANRQAMVRNNMVEDGNTLEEAKTSIDALFTAVEAIERIKLIVGSHEGITQARLDVKLTLP